MDVWIQLETIPPEIGTIESLELLNVASNKMTSLPNLDGYLAHAHEHTRTHILHAVFSSLHACSARWRV